MSKAAFFVDHQAFESLDKMPEIPADLRKFGLSAHGNHPPPVHLECIGGAMLRRD